MRKAVIFAAAALITLALAMGGQAQAQEKKVYNIRSSQVFAATHPWNKGFEKFKEIIEAKTDGQILVQNFPAASISGGNNRTMCEQVQAGTLHLLVQSPPSWSSLAPKTQIYNLPFLFPSSQVGLKVANESAVSLEILNNAFEGLGVTFLGIWENGYRNITSRNGVVHKPEDLKGLKIRVAGTPLLTDVFAHFGALPVSMSMTEVYTALQQGAVDAQENPISAIYSNKLYEVAPKITQWKYCWDPGLVTVNKKFYDSLSPELQTAIAEAIKEAGEYVNELTAREEVELVSEMEKAGTEFYTMTDEESQAFVESLKPIYDKYAPIVGEDALEKLRAEIAKTAAETQ